MNQSKKNHAARIRRHKRLRKHLRGTQERPRLAVYRSTSHIYAQLIDDDRGHTIAAASDVEEQARGEAKGKRKSDVAKLVGEMIGKRAKEQGVTAIVFDRGGYQFHGRVEALASGAREAGLKF